MQNFRLSTSHVKFHQIFTLIGSFYWRYTKFQPESTEELLLIWLKRDATFEEIPICCFKNDKKLVNFFPSAQNLQKCTKYKAFGLRKYRGVIFYDTGVSYKIFKKTDLWFGKWLVEFGKFSSEHLEVSKLGLWWDPFVQSIKYWAKTLQRSYV